MEDIAKLLARPGSIGVIATDTIYGVVARATDQAAVARLYRLKDRHHKPGTVIASSVDQLVLLGIKRRYLKAVEQFWPGAISVIIPCGEELSYLHQGLRSLALRIPDVAPLRELLERTGPLLTSSANAPGQPPAINRAMAENYFKDEVDFYQDGDNLENHQPSTIIRIVDDAIEIVRPGAVRINESGRKEE